MTSSASILRTTALLAIGGLIGAGLTFYFGQRRVRRNFAGSTCIQTIRLIRQVDLLDQQEYSLLRSDLESHLDSDICILGIFALKNDDTSALAKSQLTYINNHRKQHPYESPVPEFNHKVKSALSLAN